MDDMKKHAIEACFDSGMTVDEFKRKMRIGRGFEDDDYYYIYAEDISNKEKNSEKIVYDSGLGLFWIIEKKTGTILEGDYIVGLMIEDLGLPELK